jgi:hypothetical protein
MYYHAQPHGGILKIPLVTVWIFDVIKVWTQLSIILEPYGGMFEWMWHYGKIKLSKMPYTGKES